MVTITLLLKIILGSLNSKIIKSKWYNTERYKTLFTETMIIYIGNIKKLQKSVKIYTTVHPLC